MNLQIIKRIAEEEGLQYIETTSERNAYPRDIEGALVGFRDYAHVEEIAEKYSLIPYEFIRRDGQDLYWRRGKADGPFDLYKLEKLYNPEAGYEIFSRYDELSFYEDAVRFNLEQCTSWSDLEQYIEQRKEIFEHIQDMDETKVVIALCGKLYKIMDVHNIRLHEDSIEYVIGVR